MATLDLDRLWKIWVLASRASGGEADAACTRAAAMVRPFGYSLEDIPELLRVIRNRVDPGFDLHAAARTYKLRQHQRDAEQEMERRRAQTHASVAEASRPAPPPPPPPPPPPKNPVLSDVPQQQTSRPAPVYDAAEEAWRDAHIRECHAILDRYGSVDHVFEKTADEQQLWDAVAPYHTRVADRADPRAFTERWDGVPARKEPTQRVRDTLSRAITLPRSIPDAVAEVIRWDRLNRDRSLVARFRDGSAPLWDFVSEPVQIRVDIVRELAARTLPARTLADVITRLKFQLQHDMLEHEDAEAILNDLERLNASGTGSPGKAAPKTKRADQKAKRLMVEKILGSAEAATLSVKEIAERAGVSSSTVLKVKREIEQIDLEV